MADQLIINNLSDFKRVLKTPDVTVRGTYHHRHNEPRITHFLARFAQPRKVTHATRSYFVIDQGGRLDVTHKEHWVFNGTNEVSLLDVAGNVALTYAIEAPTPENPS